jgi:RNA polymerase sigma-70 factor (ECF subfamily)
MMRRILIDHARAKQSEKRGGSLAGERLTIAAIEPATPSPTASPMNEVDLLALDGALEKLAVISPEQARLVELRFFGGLNIEETASVLNMGKRSVDREWACAKAWLWRELGA